MREGATRMMLIAAFAMLSVRVQADIIDLSTFTADPPEAVTFSGANATITEQPGYGSIFLYTDPLLGGDGILIPSGDYRLVFEYQFVEPAGHDDELNAFLFAPDTFEHLTDTYVSDPGAGSVTWDLSEATYQGQTVGLEFDFNSYDAPTDSFITISNVRIELIPEPGSAIILFPTLLYLARRR